MTRPLDALLALEASPLAAHLGAERRLDDVIARYTALLAAESLDTFRPAELADLCRITAPEGIITRQPSELRHGIRVRLGAMHLEPIYTSRLSRRLGEMSFPGLMKLLETIQERQAALRR